MHLRRGRDSIMDDVSATFLAFKRRKLMEQATMAVLSRGDMRAITGRIDLEEEHSDGNYGDSILTMLLSRAWRQD
jgi:hypothetical protein